MAQCHSRTLLSEVKLAADDVAGEDAGRTAVVLHHLGLADERVVEVPWSDIDRTLEPDHLTSLWVPRLAAPVAVELVRLEELVRTLRARCPWDMAQTHGSLARHLLEEAYEALDAIEAVASAEPDVPPRRRGPLEEELGDLLFQVYFHAVLGAEEGRFTLADVARTVHDKLVSRHPHVFADAVADTPEEVAARWEVLKRAEKGRTSVTEGIPDALPALALAAKLQRKAASVGMDLGTLEDRRRRLAVGLDRLGAGITCPPRGSGGSAATATSAAAGSGETLTPGPEAIGLLGDLLFDLGRRGPATGGRPRNRPAGPGRRLPPAGGAQRGRLPGVTPAAGRQRPPTPSSPADTARPWTGRAPAPSHRPLPTGPFPPAPSHRHRPLRTAPARTGAPRDGARPSAWRASAPSNFYNTYNKGTREL